MNQEFDKNIMYKFFSRDITAGEEQRLLDWIDESEDHRDIFIREENIQPVNSKYWRKKSYRSD